MEQSKRSINVDLFKVLFSLFYYCYSLVCLIILCIKMKKKIEFFLIY